MIDKNEFDKAADSFCESIANGFRAMFVTVYYHLDPAEREQFATDQNGEESLNRLLRTMLLAEGPDHLIRQWNVEAIKPNVKKMKRLLKRRA